MAGQDIRGKEMTDISTTPQRVISYVNALEEFSAQSIDAFLALCAKDIEFRDPFNHTFNQDNFRCVLVDMLKHVDGLQFKVSDHWFNGVTLVIKWRFSGTARFVGPLDIPGLSEIEFNDDGLVKRHIDYWDANEHITCKLPLIGALVRLLMRPMATRITPQ